jgi:hypothetical protein
MLGAIPAITFLFLTCVSLVCYRCCLVCGMVRPRGLRSAARDGDADAGAAEAGGDEGERFHTWGSLLAAAEAAEQVRRWELVSRWGGRAAGALLAASVLCCGARPTPAQPDDGPPRPPCPQLLSFRQKQMPGLSRFLIDDLPCAPFAPDRPPAGCLQQRQQQQQQGQGPAQDIELAVLRLAGPSQCDAAVQAGLQGRLPAGGCPSPSCMTRHGMQGGTWEHAGWQPHEQAQAQVRVQVVLGQQGTRAASWQRSPHSSSGAADEPPEQQQELALRTAGAAAGAAASAGPLAGGDSTCCPAEAAGSSASSADAGSSASEQAAAASASASPPLLTLSRLESMMAESLDGSEGEAVQHFRSAALLPSSVLPSSLPPSRPPEQLPLASPPLRAGAGPCVCVC